MTYWPNPSQISQNCRQHISSPTSVTNIEVASSKFAQDIFQKYLKLLRFSKFEFSFLEKTLKLTKPSSLTNFIEPVQTIFLVLDKYLDNSCPELASDYNSCDIISSLLSTPKKRK